MSCSTCGTSGSCPAESVGEEATVTRRRDRFPVVLTAHVFDKIRSIDMTLAEFEQLLDAGEIIEEHRVDDAQLKELVLVIDWTRPLHAVVIVDYERAEERIVTLYEPDPGKWGPDFRRRRS